MKKSNTKRILSLLLALMMLVTVLAGCTTSGGKSGGSKEKTEIPTVTFPLEEPYHISVMVKGNRDYEKELAMNTFYQWLVKETNVYIDWINLGDEPLTTLNAMLATGTQGDVIIGVLTDSNVSDLAYGGFLLPIEDYLTNEELMPNYVNRGLSAVPQAISTATLPDGHVYSVARIDGGGAWGSLESPLTVNKKWVKEAGLDEIKTIDDFEQYLIYVRDHDMNGDGNPNDEVPLLIATSVASPYATVQSLLGFWGLATKDSALDSYCVVKDGVVSLAPMTDAYKEAIKVIGKWYKEGLIWSEMFVANKESFNARLNNSHIPQWGATTGTYDITYTLEYYDDLEAILYPEIEGYTPCAFLNPGYNGYKNTVSIMNTAEHPEIILAWLDLFYSREGSVAVSNGMPDDPETVGVYKTYEVSEDGIYTWYDLTPEESNHNKELRTTFSGMWGAYVWLRTAEDYDVEAVRASKSQITRRANYDLYNDAGIINKEVWPRPYYTAETSDRINLLRTDIYSIIERYEAQWATGQGDIDAEWDGYISQLKNAGVEEMVSLLQEAYDVYVAAH